MAVRQLHLALRRPAPGCFVYADGAHEPDPITGEPKQWRVVLARPEQFQVEDNWYSTGLAGSGSADYSAKDLFIPEEHCFTMSQPRRRGPIHRTPDVVQRPSTPTLPRGVPTTDYA